MQFWLLIKFLATAEFEFFFLSVRISQSTHFFDNNHSYFVNAKTGRMHRVTTPNMMLMLAPGGVIKYNARYISQICLLLAFSQWKWCEAVVLTDWNKIALQKESYICQWDHRVEKMLGLNNGHERTNILSLLWGLESQNFREPSLDLTLSWSVVDHKTAKVGSLTLIFGKTRINFLFEILTVGNFLLLNRTTIKVACLIDLRKFLMDSQVCPLVLESCKASWLYTCC